MRRFVCQSHYQKVLKLVLMKFKVFCKAPIFLFNFKFILIINLFNLKLLNYNINLIKENKKREVSIKESRTEKEED